MNPNLVHGIFHNDHGSISKAITLIENNKTSSKTILSDIHERSEQAFRIGITGPPGAGKSTITGSLIDLVIKNNKSVGVIAVDPTSPFSGGSLLGDRVRMNKYAWDDRVFVRSMGSNGDLGGLARRSQEVGDVLSASGKDFIIYETVGVGQNEHDIVKAADICIVVLVPESGDEIQMMKAGIIEIADLFVINKSDRPGANRLSAILKNILHHFSKNEKHEPKVLNMVATEKKSANKLYSEILLTMQRMMNSQEINDRRSDRYRQRVLDITRANLEKLFWTDKRLDFLKNSSGDTENRPIPPHKMADDLLSSIDK